MEEKSFKEQFLLFLSIITVIPFIVITTMNYIEYKKISNKEENTMIVDKKLGFKEEELWKLLGGKKNISDVKATYNKITFTIEDNSLINLEKLKSFPKSEGIIEGNSKVSMIFGSKSKLIEEKFNN